MITDQGFGRVCISKDRINGRENGSEIKEEKKMWCSCADAMTLYKHDYWWGDKRQQGAMNKDI